MRVRTPVQRAPGIENFNLKDFKRHWKGNYLIKTTTPIYGGGVKASNIDINMPVRASSIRGQLRYWWRHLRKNDGKHPLTGKELFNEERDTWGGMSQEKKDYASRVWIRVSNVNFNDSVPHNKYSDLGQSYALFPARQESEEIDASAQHLLPPGLTAEMTIVCRDCSEAQIEWVEKALRWWMSFGGIGARTRRGLGSIEINGLEPVTEEEAKAFGCVLVHAPIGYVSNNALLAWNSAVAKLRTFRQGSDIGRKPGSDPNNPKKLGRSHWPEPDSIREIAERYPDKHSPVHKARCSFPRALFGLPIIFELRDKEEPAKTELSPVNSERMASPIILKALPIEDHKNELKYSPIALLLPTKSLYNLSLKLKYSGSGQNDALRNMERETWWPLNNNANAQHILPLRKYKNDNPLSAFLYFFGMES